MSGHWEPVDAETAAAVLAEGVHVGLRKGVHESEGGPELWNAIHQHVGAWNEACEYFAYGLDVMGWSICKRVES